MPSTHDMKHMCVVWVALYGANMTERSTLWLEPCHKQNQEEVDDMHSAACCTGSVGDRVVREDVCLCVCMCEQAITHAPPACQRGPLCFSQKARSYLARASAAVSHTRAALLPGGG